MKLIWKNETVILRINGKAVNMEAGADVELEFPHRDQREWLEAELKRVKREKK